MTSRVVRKAVHVDVDHGMGSTAEQARRRVSDAGTTGEIAFDHLIVTIDGPAGTGKSSVGRALALRLGLEFLDTGAMYRAATALAIDRGLSLDDEEGIAKLAAEADLHFDWTTDPPTLLAYLEPYHHRLRDPDVTSAVSPVSALAMLRDVLVRKQRIIGAQHPRLVTEGRDQGSVVFPDAEVKFFVHASARVRAERRVRQMEEQGQPADIDTVEQELIRRDKADAARKVAPLVRAADAVMVDTSSMSFEQVVDELERQVRARMGARGGGGGAGS
ncbi:MAG: (d)CMP kinase [Planctomycetota bacterium]|nr:(d)CMP kinase [Planctomycetota bacterium]